MALNSPDVTGTNNIQPVCTLVGAVFLVFRRVNAQFVLVEYVFLYSYPIRCTCLEASGVMSEDRLGQFLGAPENSYSFMGVCGEASVATATAATSA